MTMNKPKLIAAINAETGISKGTISMMLDAQATAITAHMASGSVATIPGLVKLTPKNRPARTGYNPATGASVEIPAKIVVTAKVLKPVSDAVA